MGEVEAPIVVVEPDAVTVYPSVEHAESHLCHVEPEDFDGAWDADGNRLLITQSSGRVTFLPGAPDQERFRAILVERLDRVGEVPGDAASLNELVARAAEHFSVVGWLPTNSGLAHAISDHIRHQWVGYAVGYAIGVTIIAVGLARIADQWHQVVLGTLMAAAGGLLFAAAVVVFSVTVWWWTHGRRL